MSKKILIGRKKSQSYKGFLIRADLGLHDQIAENVQKLLPKGSKILDLGAGQGALSARLHDLGYNIMAVDIDPNDFKFKDIDFRKVDFNDQNEVEAFKEEFQEKFDLVLGIEVIEHIENPFEYLRLLKKLVKVSGYIIVSTPNITSWLSRINFLLKGQFHQFTDEDLSYGHIAPITAWELEMILKKEQFRNITMKSAGTLPPIWISSSLKISLANILFLLIRPFSKGLVDGWCILAIAKK